VGWGMYKNLAYLESSSPGNEKRGEPEFLVLEQVLHFHVQIQNPNP